MRVVVVVATGSSATAAVAIDSHTAQLQAKIQLVFFGGEAGEVGNRTARGGGRDRAAADDARVGGAAGSEARRAARGHRRGGSHGSHVAGENLREGKTHRR